MAVEEGQAIVPGPPPTAPKESKAGRRRQSLKPLSMDFAYNRQSSRPQSPTILEPASPESRPRSLKSLASSRKTGHYRHHEAAPRKLIRKLNSLLHGNLHRSQRSPRSGGLGIRSPFNGSATSLSRGNSAISTSSALSRIPLSAEPEPIVPELSLDDQRPAIKIRLATFNMHDTLPTSDGDFSDWLGDVSSCRPPPKKRKRSSMSSRNSTMTIPLEKELPRFALNSEHPYHIIVVASQECPTASGVLAGRVRTLDGKGWTNMLENYLCGGSCYDSDDESGSSGSEDDHEIANVRRSEDGGTPASETASSTLPPPVTSRTSREDDAPRSQAPSIHGSNSGDSRRRRGPYVLVEKERLMGIYIAVFVARSCEDLVEGVSKSRVPAGLIGGRLGNKGGVAVSLHFASSRLLFVSAHLAAHASAIEVRKANVTKILEEIVVDDFWGASGKLGPKPKNVTDRFDQAFFLGDLNFRLNVTRLHSDWLIARKEYSTALRFDQLRDVLTEKPSVFDGFAEAPINFAPTYKYDVVHRVKKKRSAIMGGRTKRELRDEPATLPFPSPDRGEDEASGSLSDPEIISGGQKLGDDDTVSIVSSVGTISTLDDFEQLERTELDKGDLASLGLPAPPKKGADTHMDAVRSAQVRFLTLVKTNSATAALHYARKRSTSTVPKSAPPLKTMFNPPRPILQSSQSALVVPMTRSTSSPLVLSASPVRGDSEREDSMTDTEPKKGLLKTLKAKVESAVPSVEPVFDSSSKQRVQSYTDRILYKSTIEPPEEEESDEEELEEPPAPPLQPSRSSIFATALRDLTHAPLHSSLKPRPSGNDLEHRRGSAEDRHLRFNDVFTRPRRASASSDSEAGIAARNAKNSMPRTKSLQPGQLRRQHSGAASVGTDETETNRKKAFWRRVASFPALHTAATFSPSSPKSSSPPSIASPHPSPRVNSAPATPALRSPASPREPSYFPGIPPNNSSASSTAASTPTRRTPRKIFTISPDSPPSSPEDTRPPSHSVNFASSPATIETPPLPRANSEQAVATSSTLTGHRSSLSNFGFPRNNSSLPHRPVRCASGSALPSPSSHPTSPRHSPPVVDPVPHVQTSTASLNTRFKSFLNSIPLPFLSAPTLSRSLNPTASSTKLVRKKKHGPRPGEIKVLEYDSVPNLAKMGAVSDHRPVFLVVAVGVESPKADPEEDGDDQNP